MYKIIWTASAIEEYLDNLRFWIDHNKSNEYSLKIVSAVEEMEEILSQYPQIGRITNKDSSILKVVILGSFYLYYNIG